MVTPAEWETMIADRVTNNPLSVTAHTYRGKRWETQCRPVVLGCEDGVDYVVKGAQTGKAVVNEQIVGKLAALLAAPVPLVEIVGVPHDLIVLNAPHLDHMRAGYAHGSPYQENCTNKQWLSYTEQPDNESRFAALAVLFGWTAANDPQFIYQLFKPHLVWSVDHGNFFPGGPDWTVPDLHGAGAASVFAEISTVCKDRHIDETLDALASVTPEQIAEAVAAPPTTWAVTMEERCALAGLLERRRDELLNSRELE